MGVVESSLDSAQRSGDLMHQVVDLKKLDYQCASLVQIEAIPYEFLFAAQPWSPTDGRTSRLEKEAQSAMGIRVSVRYHRYPKPRLLTNFH